MAYESVEHHPAFEEYSETIYELAEDGLEVIQARIAERMDVSRPAVSEMIRRMQKNGLVTIDSGSQIELTKEGHKLATTVVRRHRLAERFLTDILNLGWTDAHHEAGRWEHVISPVVEKAMMSVLDDPQTCPHGNPIPGTSYKAAKGTMALVEIAIDQEFTVRRIPEELEFEPGQLEFLEEAGVMPGRNGTVLSTAPDGTTTVSIGGRPVGIGGFRFGTDSRYRGLIHKPDVAGKDTHSMNAPAIAVSVDGIHHAYDNQPVLDDVTLDVGAGETVAILGPSGCGKTTLLRVVAGLERPTAGSVLIGGVQVSADGTFIAPERRQVGMVFQDWALFPHLSVGDNVGYGLRRGERRGSRVGEALDMVGLAGLEDRMPATLSGGQQQRVALARALAPRPGVLLLDEPFSNLDATLRVEVRTELRHLLSDLGITALFVTHDQQEAFVVGDRIAVMRDGRIAQVDTPPNVYQRPTDRWVAEFVGDASVLRCRATGAQADTPLGPIPLREHHDGEVDLLLRPEQLSIHTGDTATVELVEFYGHDGIVAAAIGDDQLRVRTGPDVPYRRGDRVSVKFVDTAAHAFPIPAS